MHLPVKTELQEEAASETVWLKELSVEAKLRSQVCEDVSFLAASAKSDSHASLLASAGLVSFTKSLEAWTCEGPACKPNQI